MFCTILDNGILHTTGDVTMNSVFLKYIAGACMGLCIPIAQADLGVSQSHKATSKQATVTELMEAIGTHDNVNVLKYLKQGTNPNEQDEDGATPLITASAMNNLQAAIILIDYGADPALATRDTEGNIHRPLVYAALADAREIMILLIYHGAPIHPGNTGEAIPILAAAYTGNASFVEILLALGADVDTQDKIHRTPLGFAAWQGHAEVVRVLLEHGADKALKDTYGNTALDLAIGNKQYETARLLMN